MTTSVVLFTRDLRVHDNPALHAAAAESERVVTLFVLDERLLRVSPARTAFLHEALADLDRSLRSRGGGLLVRRGEVARVVREVLPAGGTLHCSADHSAYARARERRLAEVCREAGAQLRRHPGVTVVPPGAVLPHGRDHFAVFTPYLRRWEEVPRRPVLAAPRRVPGDAPAAELPPGGSGGGESAGRRRMRAWLAGPAEEYEQRRDMLADDGGTSRLSAYLHFGCLSPLELATLAPAPFVRQLCWRDFFHQVLAARPDYPRTDYRDRGREWREDGFGAWREGETGVPLVDAAMRQLLAEGWMHNRARMLSASFLTKELGVDWRLGAAHFSRHLVDGDLACNVGNWQWAAGTGNDTRPNRRMSATRQAQRFDPGGEYVRRYASPGAKQTAQQRTPSPSSRSSTPSV